MWFFGRGLGICLLLAVSASAGAIMLGQIDTFTDGSLMGWGGGAQPQNISTGGPDGAGDRFLQLTAYYRGGKNGGGSLAAFNTGQWSGNYQAAGVDLIEVDMRNQGTADLYMRWVFFDSLGDRFVSANAIFIPQDNTWRHYLFPLGPANMTRVLGSGTYAQMITSVTRGMFRHNPVPSSGGSYVVGGQIGIDNILAGAVPEPTAFAVLGSALLMALIRRRKSLVHDSCKA